MSRGKAILDVFFRYRYLLKYLVQRDITVKYRRSALGIIWSVLNPLLMMLVITAVFSAIFEGVIEHFPVYLLCGQTIFTFYSESTNLAMDSVLGNSGLIKKVYIPKYIFPLEKVIFSFINTLLSLFALVIMLFVLRIPITPWILLFPLPLLLVFLFNLGVGMALASLVVFFRDIKHLYGVVVLALTYLTPIFYPVDALPAFMQIVIRCNPLYWYVAMFRQFVLYGQGPTLWQCLLTVFWAALALLVGFIIFKKTQDRFILYI